MRVTAIVQARLGSTRLPRKALARIGGKPLICHVLGRVRQVPSVGRVVLAVPTFSDFEEMRKAGVSAEVWCDTHLDERDVLARYAGCAESVNASTVLRVTGDCPLWDPAIGEAVIELYRRSDVDYASNITAGYRDGEDAEVFSVAALMRAHREATDPADREHVTPWIRRNCRTATLQPNEIRSDVKTSVDTAEDLERVRIMADPAVRLGYVTKRWDGLLKRLAE